MTRARLGYDCCWAVRSRDAAAVGLRGRRRKRSRLAAVLGQRRATLTNQGKERVWADLACWALTPKRAKRVEETR
jgi:hypothetical protein